LIEFIVTGSYGNNRPSTNGYERDRHGGNSLLDDLDSFDVGPLRPGPPVIKNFYIESPLITSRPQVIRFFSILIKIYCLFFNSI
jgi:hypothetical protein